MRQFDALRGYPKPAQPRLVGPKLRTIRHKIAASYRGREYYHGDRNTGHGGLRYDGRWLPIAQNMCREYGLNGQSAVLHMGCEMGFLLHEFLQIFPEMKVRGTDLADYAIEHALPSVKPLIRKSPYLPIPFADAEFDLVIAVGPIYELNLPDAIQCLKEIQRVGKGKSFITLGAYETEEDLALFRHWSLLGTTILREDEWITVLEHAGYTGDYKFNTAESLHLVLDR